MKNIIGKKMRFMERIKKSKIATKFIIYLMITCLLVSMLPQQVSASDDTQKLLSNLKGNYTPLTEYNDPIIYAEKYSSNFFGKAELFLVNWKVSSLVTTKNDKWQKSDEQALLEILNDKSILKAYLNNRPEGLIAVVNSTVKNISSAIDKRLLKDAKTVGIADKWITSALKDAMKLEIKNSQIKMELLGLLAINTNDSNLKKACENCRNTIYTNTIDTIKTTIVSRLISLGVKKAKALTIANEQTVMAPVKAGFKKGVQALGECAKGVSYALIFLDAKDLVTYVTGIQSKTNAYMKIVSYQCIYNSALTTFKLSAKQYKKDTLTQGALIDSLFNMLLVSKQKAYENLPKMMGETKWEKELRSNSLLKSNTSEIKTITITNYKKKKTTSSNNEKPNNISSNTCEMSKYLNYSAESLAKKLGIKKDKTFSGKSRTYYCNGTYPTKYTIQIACNTSEIKKKGKVEFSFVSTKYSLFGVKIGMDLEECKKLMKKAAGYKLTETNYSSDIGVGTYIYRNNSRTIRFFHDGQKCNGISYY